MTTRAAAIGLVADYLANHVGGKRAAVFKAITADLADGPAPVPLRRIRDRIVTGPTFVPVSARKLDLYTERLVTDGWLTVVTEAEPGKTCRVWDLGPSITSHMGVTR